METPKWLKLAAQHSEGSTWTLGHIFARYRELEGKSSETLAAELGCSLEVLDWLSLCRCPEEDRFAEHLSMIEKRFAVDHRRLAVMIRRVEVLDALSTGLESGRLPREESVLLAARDHSDDDDDDENSS